MSLAYPITL